jgi:hypothetical protein
MLHIEVSGATLLFFTPRGSLAGQGADSNLSLDRLYAYRSCSLSAQIDTYVLTENHDNSFCIE